MEIIHPVLDFAVLISNWAVSRCQFPTRSASAYTSRGLLIYLLDQGLFLRLELTLNISLAERRRRHATALDRNRILPIDV